jgi:hypothetical protein
MGLLLAHNSSHYNPRIFICKTKTAMMSSHLPSSWPGSAWIEQTRFRNQRLVNTRESLGVLSRVRFTGPSYCVRLLPCCQGGFPPSPDTGGLLLWHGHEAKGLADSRRLIADSYFEHEHEAGGLTDGSSLQGFRRFCHQPQRGEIP